MSALTYSDAFIRKVLTQTQTIAVVGASPKPHRPSYGVMAFLLRNNYTVFPINPGVAGQEILGQKVYATLADVAHKIDMVDIFRNSADAGKVADEAVALATEKGIQSIWMQLAVINEDAAERAEAAGLDVIMDRCPAIEYPRLMR